MPARSSRNAPSRCTTTTTSTSLHERIKVAERSLLVEVVAALTSPPYTVTGRKVSIG